MAQDFTDPFPPLDRTCSLVEPMSLADGDPICNQFIEDWKSGQQPRIEDYLGSASASERNVLLLKLLSVELSLRRQAGESDPRSLPVPFSQRPRNGRPGLRPNRPPGGPQFHLQSGSLF